MTDDSIRYSRQQTLTGWGADGQVRLSNARILMVGLGGLGVPAATYLAAAGAGRLVLNDFDRVDESNLARQPLYTPDDIGRAKVTAAAERLAALNPDCELVALDRRLDDPQLRETMADCDVVVDGSDNFSTRFAVNAASVQTQTPLVSGAAIRGEAQLAVFRPDLHGGPCYRCLYAEGGDELEDCRGQGVIPALVGMIGCAMALEAMRIVVGFGEPLRSRLLVYDAMAASWRSIGLEPDPSCPVCRARGGDNAYTAGSRRR